MNSRVVLYGHGSFYNEDGKCIIPEGTSLTLYAPHGALIHKTVVKALLNGEDIPAQEIEFPKEELYFDYQGLVKSHNNQKFLKTDFPKTFRAGDSVPNFYLKPAPQLDYANVQSLAYTPTEVKTVTEKKFLKDLLHTYQYSSIHWAACSLAKTNLNSYEGYGYACKFKVGSIYNELYKDKEKPPIARSRKTIVVNKLIKEAHKFKHTKAWSNSNKFFNRRKCKNTDINDIQSVPRAMLESSVRS